MGLTVEELDQACEKGRGRPENAPVLNKSGRSENGGKKTKSLKLLLKTTSAPKPKAKLICDVAVGRKLQDLPELPNLKVMLAVMHQNIGFFMKQLQSGSRFKVRDFLLWAINVRSTWRQH